MIILDDKNRALYQWDTGQRVILPRIPAGTKVDFAHDGGEPLGVEAYKEGGKTYANIPNVLLQSAEIINMWVYLRQGEVGETVLTGSIRVTGRDKPSDYVYSETEIKQWNDLVARIEELEQNGVSADVVEKAVKDYLAENPAGGVDFEVDHTLKLENGILSVNTADVVEKDNTRPVTSAAVDATVGNIEILLKSI